MSDAPADPLRSLEDRVFAIRATAEQAIATADANARPVESLLMHNQLELLELIAVLWRELIDLRRRIDE